MPLNETFQMPKAKTFDPLPKGIYHCQLIDIESKVWEGQDEPSLNFTFVPIEGEHYGKKVFASASLNMKGGTKPTNLYKLVTGLTGKDYTAEECKNQQEWMTFIFLSNLIGTQVNLVLSVAQKKTGGLKNVIDSILPVKEDIASYVPKQ